MKKTKTPLLLALFLTALPVFSGCKKEQEQILVESISLSKTSAELVEGESVVLTAKIAPSNATNKSINWKSDDTGVAKVDQKGNVTAVKAGKAVISVTADDGRKSAICAVTVKAKVKSVASVTLNKDSASLKVGETITLEATVNPGDATDKTVIWRTSDATVATVSDGLVTALKIGNATITAQAGEKIAVCAITIVPTPVTSITLNKTTASLMISETLTIIATVNPGDATDKSVKWSSDNEAVVTVSANGVVTAMKVGKATVTATTVDQGKTAICTVEVSKNPETIDGGIEGTGEEDFVF